jgi:hypothetical protein
MAREKQLLKEKDLQGFKYLRKFFSFSPKFHLVKQHHNRDLHFDQYICLLLFFFFNPLLTSLRSIQQASTLKKVQKKLCVNATSLGALSEASHVFDADMLQPLIEELAQKALPIETDPQLKQLQQQLVAVDGTLLPALPKMLWALWVDDQNKAAKLHLEFDIKRHIPVRANVTDANSNEKHSFREFLSAEKLYVLDAGYGEYKLLSEIKATGSSFVIRLRDNAVWDSIEQKPLTQADQQAGITNDIICRLGSRSKQQDCQEPLRVIELYHKGDESVVRKSRVSSKKTFRTTDSDYTMLLVTDRMDLPAETVALLYRYRWQIELFFRWFKCVLGCKHFLAQSQNGVTLQVYTALIASMLITLWTGRKPTKRTFEMLSFYFMGWADDDELAQHIQALQPVNETVV